MIFKGLDKSLLSVKSIPDVDILAIEEAETISQRAYDVAIPSIRKKGSEIWVVGNNRLETDPTSQMFLGEHRPKDMILMRATYLQNPHCSPDFLADADLMKVKDYDLYRHFYLGEFLKQSALRLVKRIKTTSEDIANYITSQDWVIVGVDIAGTGGDKTVIFVRSGLRILHHEVFDTMDLDQLIIVLNRIIGRYKPHVINIDSTGYGALAPQALRREGIIVRGVNFAEGSDNLVYANRRTEIYGLIQDFFDRGGAIPPIKELIRDLEQSLFKLDTKNRYQMIPKKEIKDIIGCSPDFGDAFALTMLVGKGDDIIKAPNAFAERLQARHDTMDLVSAGMFDESDT
jgi:hypothetical protein